MAAELTTGTEAFTDAEKDGIMRFLGYPNWRLMAQSIQLGIPSASQPLFLVISAFERVAPETRSRVRVDLCRCFALEDQIASSASRVKTTRVGEVHMNGNEMGDLGQRIHYFATRIADALGVVPNPYSQAEYAGLMSGGINARVIG